MRTAPKTVLGRVQLADTGLMGIQVFNESHGRRRVAENLVRVSSESCSQWRTLLILQRLITPKESEVQTLRLSGAAASGIQYVAASTGRVCSLMV